MMNLSSFATCSWEPEEVSTFVQCLYKILILCIFVGDVASSQNIYFSTLKTFFYLTSLTFLLLCELLCKEFLCFYVFSDDSIESPFVVQLNLRQIRLWNWSHVMNFSFSPFLGGSERIPNTKKRQRKMFKCNYVSIIHRLFTKPEEKGWRWCKESINHKTPNNDSVGSLLLYVQLLLFRT